MCLLAARTEFCANFTSEGRYAIANSPMMTKFQTYLAFGYSVGEGGHALTVQVLCYWKNKRGKRKKTVVKLANDKKTHYKKIIRQKDPKSGSMCVKLRREGECPEFQIKFTAWGKSRVCVKGIRYMSDRDNSFCGKVIQLSVIIGFTFVLGTVDNKL